MYIDKKFINNRIAFLRNQKGVSARDMSLSIGQSDNYINKIENCKALPSIKGLALICEYFDITFQEFFDIDNKSPNDMKELFNEIKNLDMDSVKHLTEFVKGVKKLKSKVSKCI